MKAIALIILIFPIMLADGQSTLTLADYCSLCAEMENHVSNTQLYYMETKWTAREYSVKKMIIYGNNKALFESEHYAKDEQAVFYLTDDGLIEKTTNDIVSLGLFDNGWNEKYLLDAIDMVVYTHYLSLQVGNKYFSLRFSDLEEVEPSWQPIIDYIRSIMDEYMIDDNEVEADEYLNVLKSQQEVYGIHPRFDGSMAEKQIEEHKLE